MRRELMAIALTGIVGCGGSGDGGTSSGNGTKPYPSCEGCMHTQYVVSSLTVPMDAMQLDEFACDLDADGAPDNRLGQILRSVADLAHVDVQGAVNASFTMGQAILLFDIVHRPSLIDAETAGIKAFFGTPAIGQTAPTFYDGSGMFATTTSSGSGFGGTIQGGNGSFGPGVLDLKLALAPGLEQIPLKLERVEVSGVFTTSTITTGKLCGVLPADQIRPIIFPAVAKVMSEQVRQANMYSDQIKGFDPDHSCDSDPACVPSAPIGGCRCITTEEIETNGLVLATLQPDLDLDPAQKNPFADPNQVSPTDENDALSMGIRFGANSASFSLPPD